MLNIVYTEMLEGWMHMKRVKVKTQKIKHLISHDQPRLQVLIHKHILYLHKCDPLILDITLQGPFTSHI